MRRENVLICEKDVNYVKALVAFLMGWESVNNMGINVTGITESKDYENLRGSYDLALLGEGFPFDLKKDSLGLKKVLFLSDEKSEKEDFFYKYQNMETLCGILSKDKRQQRISDSDKPMDMQITGIYSPGKHELTLPFSLCICKMLARNRDVLFVDLSEIGTLSALMGETPKEDLIDAIYLMENKDIGASLERFIISYEGFSILSPVATPSQLSYITPGQWGGLLEKIKESGFKNVVILFGSLVQGFAELAGRLESLLVLKRSGDYYAISDRVFMEFMEKLTLSSICREVMLPMSASNLTNGSFRLDALINGNLLDYVRKEVVLKGARLEKRNA